MAVDDVTDLVVVVIDDILTGPWKALEDTPDANLFWVLQT
jgi:hypothetical protein